MQFDPVQLTDLAIRYGLNLVTALITLVAGLYIVGFIIKFIEKVLDRRRVDPSLQGFLLSLASIMLKIMVYISAIGMLGVEMTSFIALLGAAGLAVGMALSGTLQNFAGGVMILLFKPYKVGDVIEAQGYTGTVKEIQIFLTVLTTPDFKTILIPNGPLATGSLINFSTQDRRRVDWTFGIAYGDNIDTAYSVLNELISADERILKDPEPFIALQALADSSVNIVVRVWVMSSDYWAVYFRMNEEVYRCFEQRGLHFPYPQMDVHLRKQEG